METNNNTQFQCPVGECSYFLSTTPKYITHHIQKYHPQAMIQLNQNNAHNNAHQDAHQDAHYCKQCDTYTTNIHYHCKYCKIVNKTFEDGKFHKSLYHKKWWLEKKCFKGQSCLDDTCNYNHYEYERNYIVCSETTQPMSLCGNDMPWLGKDNRCGNIYCDYDHLSGWVNHIKDIMQISSND